MAYGAILGQKPPSPDPPYKVGDTLTTARTDLGDKWLLCNGESIDSEDYPALSSVLPPVLNSKWEGVGVYNASDHGSISAIFKLLFLQNNFLMIGQRNTTIATIAHSQDAKNWTIVDVWTGSGSLGDGTVNGIAYGNGYYVAVGSDFHRSSSSSQSVYYERYAYTTDLSAGWTEGSLFQANGSTSAVDSMDNFFSETSPQIKGIIFSDGYFITVSQRNSRTMTTNDIVVSYTTDPSGSWDETTVVSENDSASEFPYATSMNGVIKINSTYYVFGQRKSKLNAGYTNCGVIFYSNNLQSDNWDYVTISSLSNILGMDYIDGEFFVWGERTSSGTSQIFHGIELSEISLIGLPACGTSTVVYAFKKVDDYYLAANYSDSLYYTKNIDEHAAWILIPIGLTDTRIEGVVSNGNTIVVNDYYTEQTPNTLYAHSMLNGVINLPEISAGNGLYTYIKAEE